MTKSDVTTQWARLENWEILGNRSSPYDAPEAAHLRLTGEIHDDKTERFEDGTVVTTSSIREFDWDSGTVRTRNSFYTLGQIAPAYRAWLEANAPDSAALAFVGAEAGAED